MATSWFVWYFVISDLGLVLIGLTSYIDIPKLTNFLTYGKIRNAKNSFQVEKYLNVPKRWFTHFYLISVICSGYALSILVQILFFGLKPPTWYIDILKMIVSVYPGSSTSKGNLTEQATPMMIGLTLMVIQGSRRLLECLFLSKYSNATMNILHYLLGLTFYMTMAPAIFAFGPDLNRIAPYTNFEEILGYIKWNHIVGVSLFLWATWHHHVAHKILANLRSDAKDINRHKIPSGDWFELVSSPHYTAEIIIYIAIGIVLGPNYYWWLGPLTFTLISQLVAGSLVHQWYLKKFDNYPKHRKAIIPWIY